MSAKHTVFVLGIEGQPLTPTTPAKARKLLGSGQAEPTWSKFGTFGIQMLVETRRETPDTSLGIDTGTKFEGYAAVVDRENNLSVKLDLPDKKKVGRKLDERRMLRRNRRRRKCRRRPARFNNRKRNGFIAPSQLVVVNSRLKVLRELFRIYPITHVGLEDVRFNHAANHWGKNFSTAEIGKQRLRDFILSHNVDLYEFRGWETKGIRERYTYKKSSDRSADRFEAHCTDALALACEVGIGLPVELGPFVIVDDTYRPVRRRLHDTQFSKGAIRDKYSCGTVFGLRKGLLVGMSKGKRGWLCGELKGVYRYVNEEGKRAQSKRLDWISSQFITRREAIPHSTPAFKRVSPAANSMEIYDKDGNHQSWEWLTNKYGNVRFLDAGNGPKFALSRIDETEGPALIKVRVIQVKGSPATNQPIANHWPDSSLTLLTGGNLKTLWYDYALIQRTDANGFTGFGLGNGSYIKNLLEGGPHTIWVLSPSIPSDGLAGIGMLGGTNHTGPLFLTFAVTESIAPPEPPIDESLEAKIRAIHADLRKLMIHLGT